jgi:hypothetical protein
MASALETNAPGPETASLHVPRSLRAHAWLAALVICVLVGAGFRLVPNSVAAPSGAGAGSTACAAK